MIAAMTPSAMSGRRELWRRRKSARAASQPFLPTAISGARLWLRGDMVDLEGANVRTWYDLSGAGNHVTQATVAQQPLYVPGSANCYGRPALRVSGGQRMVRAGWAQAQPLTVYMVFYTTSVIDNFLFDSTTNGARCAFYFSGGNFGAFAGAVPQGTLAVAVGQLLILRVRFSGATSNIRRRRAGADGSQAVAGIGSQSMTGLTLFDHYTPAGVAAIGDCAEVVVYNRDVVAEETPLIAYFGARYGIP